ncbi:MAG TPA: DUF6705 family protein, partial [Chryseobacterium sp.]
YDGDIPINGYYKDLNGELNKYVGVWKGTWNGKIIYLDLKKVKYYYDGNHPYYRDEILGERKVIGQNGPIEIDRISNFSNTEPEISGLFGMYNNPNKSFLFFPKDMCRKYGTLEIKNFDEVHKKMTLHFEYYPSFDVPNCQHAAYVAQHGEYPINFPKDIVLTKQP